MLRGVSKSVSKPLCILMNISFEEGTFPDIWKIANVIPILKKGDKSQPSNYRLVALLNCIGKLEERIVFKNMHYSLLDNNLLYKYQSGFLPQHSIVFQLINIFHNKSLAFDNYMFSCNVFCDVSKAFDRVWHKGFLLKVSKGAKIRNRYNQVPHLTQDTNGKVTNSQLDTTNESQDGSPFPAGYHKAHIKTDAHKGIANTRQKKT